MPPACGGWGGILLRCQSLPPRESAPSPHPAGSYRGQTGQSSGRQRGGRLPLRCPAWLQPAIQTRRRPGRRYSPQTLPARHRCRSAAAPSAGASCGGGRWVWFCSAPRRPVLPCRLPAPEGPWRGLWLCARWWCRLPSRGRQITLCQSEGGIPSRIVNRKSTYSLKAPAGRLRQLGNSKV
jgi:hypothetical protein